MLLKADMQHTISSDLKFEGVGLHTGQHIKMTVKPADPNKGYVFCRIDLPGKPEIPALVNNVTETQRSTTIAKGEASVRTIEHLLAALKGMSVDNALIELDGPEVPILDGSSKFYIQAIQNVGTLAQDVARNYYEPRDTIIYSDEDTGAEYILTSADHLELQVMVDFDSNVLVPQYAELDHLEDFATDISHARTFVFLRDIKPLLSQGMIKGGDIDNAIVIVDVLPDQAELDELAELLDKKDVKVHEAGVLNTVSLNYPNEIARHKLLDLLGDISLLGVSIKGRLIATKPGHAANTRFTKLLLQKYKEYQKLKNVPQYDLNEPVIKDVNDIMEMLPHRWPFLLVDKIIALSDQEVVGIKNITMDEYFFQGHFPNNPIFPGVLQMEALAQTGGILALSTVEDPENWDTYFLKIDAAKFKAKVLPGDTLVLKMTLLEPIRRGIVKMQGFAYVGDKLVSEGVLTAQIVRRIVD